MDSMTLARLEQMAMGRSYPGSKGSPYLGTGSTFAIFQHERNVPVSNEMKDKLRSGLTSDEEQNFKTRAGIPSGPEDSG